jgi:hypothetical protein
MKKKSVFHALAVGLTLVLFLILYSCDKKECSLSYASGAPEEVAQRFLAALEVEDTTGLWDLRVTEAEYKNLIWPAYEKIGYGLSDQPWFINRMDADKAIGRALGEFGGKKLKLVRAYFAKGQDEQIGEFKIWRDFRILVRNEKGEEDELRFINTVIEMNGGYKVVAYHS